MNRLKKIQEAISYAQDKGIKIAPGGAVFDWTHQSDWPRPIYEEELPTVCNWVGAILIKLGYTRSTPLPWSEAGKYLEIGTYWMYRFHMGFDRGRQLKRKVVEKGKKTRWINDPTSKLGLDLGKKYWRKSWQVLRYRYNDGVETKRAILLR